MLKISVIVAIYNAEKFLKRCIDSILNQTIKDIEIICVNDGSTDGSALILDGYKQFSNIKIITQENKGISEARNTGLTCAKGEYIAFMDADDFIDNDFYEKLYTQAIKHDADIACAGIIRENEKKKTIIVKYNELKIAQNIQEKFTLAQCPESNYVWNKIYKRSFLDRYHIRFVPGMIYEDLCFTPDVLEVANRLVAVPQTVYHYWKHKESTIKANNDKSRADKLCGHKYLMEKCKKYNLKVSRKDNVVSKSDFLVFGLNLLRIKRYSATRKFYLFGLLKFLEIRDKV